MLSHILNKLLDRHNLTEQEMTASMEQIMDGNVSPTQIGAFLAALRMKGETLSEITAGAKVMRDKALSVDLGDDYAIDTCGTGGDGAHTFNISTVVAFVAAAAGVKVVKHGNRSVSSKCGSADVLEQLGVNIELDSDSVKKCVEQLNIGFVYAPKYHLAMKNVVQPRRELGVRTIFNLLGPLTNPAGVKGQFIGVFAEELTEVFASVLQNLGVKRAIVAHGLDGLDEITLTTKTKISELKQGFIKTYLFNPEDYGFQLTQAKNLVGGNITDNAQILLDIFNGELGPKRDVVLLNAGAAIYVGNQADSIAEGITKAALVIDKGLALAKVKELVAFTQECKAS